MYFAAWVFLIFPLWKICQRVGRNPVISLISIFPFLGLMALALILAFGRWPSFDVIAPQTSGER